MGRWGGSMWGRYVPVSERRGNAQKEMEKLKKKGEKIEPISIEGRKIATKFWGEKWCNHLDTFADYDNRLPRGKTYVRNGSVCHLSITEGVCEAIVSGSELYKVVINIAPLTKIAWEKIKEQCRGQIGSILELLQGKLSDQVMKLVTDPNHGIFPKEKEFSCSCSCPDWANVCKHVAAVFYGIASRLDQQPELLFRLRSVDASELVSTKLALDTESTAQQLASDDLGAIFGIELDEIANPVSKKQAVEVDVEVPKSSKKAPKTAKAAKTSRKRALTVDNITGKTLKSLREERNLSAIQFAQILGVTPASVYRWEKMEATLNLHKGPKSALEKYLITVDELLDSTC